MRILSLIAHEPIEESMILETNIARMFAALSATNEAILHAKSPDQLFQQVCEAALSSGDFLVTAILLLKPGTGSLVMTAGAGRDIEWLRAIDISIDERKPEGLEHVPAKWNPVRRQGHASTVESTAFSVDMGSRSDPISTENAV